VVFVPALTGLGAPHWDPDARGLITGLTRGSSAAHLARATLEGIAFQIAELAQAMAQDAKKPLRRLRVDGGASMNALLDAVPGRPAGRRDRPAQLRGDHRARRSLPGRPWRSVFFADQNAVAKLHRIEQSFRPTISASEREQHLERWRVAVRRARSQLEIMSVDKTSQEAPSARFRFAWEASKMRSRTTRPRCTAT